MERGGDGYVSRKLKPTITDKREIERLIHEPMLISQTSITGARRNLMWRYVHSIKENKYALTKFLRCVDWTNQKETKTALKHMRNWAPIDVSSALEMLSPSFTHPDVRQHAVDELQRADNDALCSYLLQLVQALRYESDPKCKPLADFLFSRCSKDMTLCNYFFWYLKVETEDEKKGEHFQSLLDCFIEILSRDHQELLQAVQDQDYMRMELESLVNASLVVKGQSARVERMRKLVNAEGNFAHLMEFKRPIRVACSPHVTVTGMRAQASTFFKSNMAPLLCGLETDEGEGNEGKQYKVIFKAGDDLRQDQLIMQMFNLMDGLLKKVHTRPKHP